ncbi:serine/threonine protein kinase, partial [Streptomyces sp. NPDC022067]
TVLAVVLSSGDDGGGNAKGASGGDKSTSAAGVSGGTEEGQGTDKSGQSAGESPNAESSGEQTSASASEGSDDESDDGGSGDDSGKGEDGGGKGGLPDGYKTVKSSDFPFSMAMPEDWSVHSGSYSGSRKYYGGSSIPRIQVDFTDSPRSDAVADWKKGEENARRTMSGYKGLGIKSIDWNGYPTVADWQFERNQDGKRVRAINRGFKADGSHGFAILITCEASKWDDEECATLRQTAFDTFKITD